MPALHATQQRLLSVIATRKTTRAMMLVAVIKMRQALKKLASIQEYYTSVYETFQHLFTQSKNLKKVFPQHPKPRTLFLVVGSNLGLCGAYNANVLRLFHSRYKPGDLVIALGTKIVNNLKNKNVPIFTKVTTVGDQPNYNHASAFGLEAISHFMDGEISKVELIYTKYVNAISFKPTCLQLLPVTPAVGFTRESNQKGPQAITEFEPSPEVVVKQSLKLYISAIIFGGMVEAKTAEVASRRTAMENATDNAGELIDDLRTKYNRARQANITQAIGEIISGFNAS